MASELIIVGINGGLDIWSINECLEKSNYPQLKVSSDMPSARITNSSIENYSELEEDSVNTKNKKEIDSLNDYEEDEWEYIGCRVEIDHRGLAPMDYDFYGEITIENNKSKKYYVQALFINGDSIFGTCKKSIFDENPSEDDVIEQYASLSNARKSVFFEYYLDLDKLTDKKAMDVLDSLDDTRNYGCRTGAKFTSDGVKGYIEFFNNNQPEYKEYLQIIKTEKGVRFTASHESYFMRYELEDLYTAYYGEKRMPEYYISIDDINDLDEKYSYFRDTFCMMLNVLDEKIVGVN